jgi:predicted ATPase
VAARGLIGREVELHFLRDRLARITWHGGAVVISGEHGIGKSCLLDEVAANAAQSGCIVVQAKGEQTRTSLPFAGLQQLVSSLLGSVDSLAPLHRHALLTALGLQGGPAPGLFQIALATLSLLTESASVRPVVALVDDAQWLDAPTKDVLTFVSRRVRDDSVIMVIAVRTGCSAFTSSSDEEITLHPLTDEDSRKLLNLTAGDLSPAVRDAILRQASGNPLALLEIPVAWRAYPR